MNRATDSLVGAINAGILEAGASQFIGSVEHLQPFDPTKEVIQVTIVELVGNESDPNTWEEYPTSKITVRGAAVVVEDQEVATTIECNLNTNFQINVKIENEQEFEYKGMYLLSSSPFKLLTRSREYETKIEDSVGSTIGIICERKQ